MDIGRYGRREAVLARPPSRLYRFQKLVRRNRARFAAGAGMGLALAIGLSVSTWMFFREREARQEQVRLRAIAAQALANEASLRRQLEDRERIAQSAFPLSRDNMANVDYLASKVTAIGTR